MAAKKPGGTNRDPGNRRSTAKPTSPARNSRGQTATQATNAYLRGSTTLRRGVYLQPSAQTAAKRGQASVNRAKTGRKRT